MQVTFCGMTFIGDDITVKEFLRQTRRDEVSEGGVL